MLKVEPVLFTGITLTSETSTSATYQFFNVGREGGERLHSCKALYAV